MAIGLSPHAATREWLLFHADASLRLSLRQEAESILAAPTSWRQQLIALQWLRALQVPELPAHAQALADHAQARLRELAFVIRLGLPGMDTAALTCRALADPSPRVSRAALAALRKGRVSLAAAELLALAQR